MEDKNINHLVEIGFVKVGHWFYNVENQRLNYMIYDQNDLLKDNLLYAMESDTLVKYIGITESTLKDRMNNYKGGYNELKSGKTNSKVYKEIFNLLEIEKSVSIYILKEKAPCDFKGYEISLATGIEKSLIRAFDLENQLWNKRGVKNNKSSMNASVKKNTTDLTKKEQLVYDYIKNNQPICDDCIAENLGFNKRQSANSSCNSLVDKKYVLRNENKECCNYCKSKNSRPKILNRIIK